VFFIPLWAPGLLVFLTSLPVFFAERHRKSIPPDPRLARLNADEAELTRLTVGGDKALSASVRDLLLQVAVPEAKLEDSHIFTRSNDGAVLVLVKAPNLRKFKDNARTELLDAIETAIEGDERFILADVYIGVRGTVAYGAIRTPRGGTQTGTVLLPTALLDFYGPATPTSGPSTRPTTSQTDSDAADSS
jgi:hypothetical protein